jgi:hypothetical protein
MPHLDKVTRMQPPDGHVALRLERTAAARGRTQRAGAAAVNRPAAAADPPTTRGVPPRSALPTPRRAPARPARGGGTAPGRGNADISPWRGQRGGPALTLAHRLDGKRRCYSSLGRILEAANPTRSLPAWEVVGYLSSPTPSSAGGQLPTSSNDYPWREGGKPAQRPLTAGSGGWRRVSIT